VLPKLTAIAARLLVLTKLEYNADCLKNKNAEVLFRQAQNFLKSILPKVFLHQPKIEKPQVLSF
jgi:hypothetical protein